MKASLSLNKNSSGQKKKFHFYDTKADTTVAYTALSKDGSKSSIPVGALPTLGPAFKEKIMATFTPTFSNSKKLNNTPSSSSKEDVCALLAPAYQANTKKTNNTVSSKFIPPFLNNKKSNNTRPSTSLFSTNDTPFQSSKKSNNTATSSRNIISNFFIKPNDKISNNDNNSNSNKSTSREKKDITEKSFTSPFSNSSRRINEIPVGKATILRGSDLETSAVRQSSSHSTRAQEQHRDIRPTEAENLKSNSLEFSDEEKENMMPSKRTFSEFDDVGLHSDQQNEFKRLKTMQNDDDDEDDQLIGNLFNCDEDDFNYQDEDDNEFEDNNEYAQDPESDFDFNIPSPRSPEYLSPNNSPAHFTDDIDIDNNILVSEAFPETKVSQNERPLSSETNLRQAQIQREELQRLPADDPQANCERSQAPADDLQTKFEKSSADYVSVLEEIADTLKTLDDDFLQNVLGKEKYDSYKKRQIARNRLRAEKRRLSARMKQRSLSISQDQNSTLNRNASLSQNIAVNGGQSTPYNTSTRRVSDDSDFPLCGESFFDESPPVSRKSSSMLQQFRDSDDSQRNYTLQQDTANLQRNSMLQPAKESPNFATPVSSKWQTSSPAFQNQDPPDIIDIEDDEIPPRCPGPNLSKSSTPLAFNSRGCEQVTPRTGSGSTSTTRNMGANERSSNARPRKTAPKKTGNSLPDDGYRSEFKRTDYAFTAEMNRALRRSFGLKCFRSNQHEAITAAMLDKDCFILMPTGGGKSLCYQLPAIISDGVTIVVSPLKSLIQDQVMKLVSNHIPAYQMTGETSESVVSNIYRDLHSSVPETKLLYVTPEKLSASSKLNSALQYLYQRKHLSRFVIDEAHCVSQWGHDFRPDYKKLSALKENFPLVPIMALTATATPRVRKDIVTQLRMKTPMWFSQSFNRPNLQFLIRPKKGKVVVQITETIKKSHANDSGIIYCLSRNECDKVAGDLRNAGIQAIAYHAGLSDSQRSRIQEDWIRDRCKVICATIAFGMGIDKADVRFVFHHSMPKSLEGYFQECGRSGRDGQNSVCILFYAYSDVYRLKRMVLSDKTMNKASASVHMNNLYRVVQYCENQTECRRAQLLEYFGETGFDSAECSENQATICDNCSCAAEMVDMDVTQVAKMIVESVNTLIHRGNSNWKRPMAQLTLKHLVDVFKGSQNAKVERESLNRCVMYGKADENFHRNDAERLFRMLVMQDILAEDLTVGAHSQVISYAKLGPKAMDFLNGRAKLPRFFKRGTKSSKRGTDTKGETSNNTNVTNTCYQQLVSCCKRLAEESGMKPHHIFADVTLRQMADKLPMTREEMLDIEGVTEYKMDKFGQQFLELTLAYGGALLTSDNAMTSDFESMIENDRMSTGGEECESPYWASAGNFTAGNKKSKFKKRGKFQSKKKKSNYQAASKSKNTSKKAANSPSTNTNNYMNNPIVNKYQSFSKNRNLGSARNPGFLSLPPKKF